jgi:hypothetical protein
MERELPGIHRYITITERDAGFCEVAQALIRTSSK